MDFEIIGKQELYEEKCNFATIKDYREYIIKSDDKNNYILRFELKEKYIYFIVYSNNQIDYNYKTFMDLPGIVKKLKLSLSKYNNFELILKLFEELYKNNKIFIKMNSNEYCSLIFNFTNVSKENLYEIKMIKNYFLNFNDKFKIMFNLIKSLKNNNIDNNNTNYNNTDEIIENMNNKINILDKKLEQKDKIISEMNTKLINQENIIKDLNEKLYKLKNDYNNAKEELKKCNNTPMYQNNLTNNNDKTYLNSNNDDYPQDINNENDINMKELVNKNSGDQLILNQAQNIYKTGLRIHKFSSYPKNLKFKYNITTTNTPVGWNDIFEVFISSSDNKEYLVSPNSNNFNLDIFDLSDNKLVYSLPGHNNLIRTVRYNNDYLISADDDKIVIIWDINNNYKIKHLIKTNYEHDINSCLLFFDDKNGKNNHNYIITSTFNYSGNDEDSSTKIYSFEDGKFIRNINKTNNIPIFYLLSWIHRSTWGKKYYIIQFSSKKILISNILTGKVYTELINEPEADHYCGFITKIYEPNSYDGGHMVAYLYSSSSNGYINIWNLEKKKISKVINTNGCCLTHIIDWNEKFLIVADYYNKLFKIIDKDKNYIYDMKTDYEGELVCIKKIRHLIYGESLLTASNDKTIKLWA